MLRELHVEEAWEEGCASLACLLREGRLPGLTRLGLAGGGFGYDGLR